MPDPQNRTVSATESPALFNASPYLTRWMLWRKYARGDKIEPAETERMFWGKELQPLLTKRAAHDLKLEVHDNVHDHYMRHSTLLMGCTRDALIYDPNRGWGSLECKCVFDYGVWFREWQSGQVVPRHYEIQLQHQMICGDGEQPHAWGVIAAWVCGEMHYFERAPIEQFHGELLTAIGQFWASLSGPEPEPFGEAVEYPLLRELFDPPPGAVKEDPQNYKLAEIARLYKDFRANYRFYEKGAVAARLELLKAIGHDHEALHLAGDIWVRVTKTKNNNLMVKVEIPDVLPDEIIDASEGIS